MQNHKIAARLLLGALMTAATAGAQEIVPVGEEFQVNTYTTDDQVDPDVAPLPTGGFVVVWDSYGSDGSDQIDSSVQAQLYDDEGAPIGDQFQVNTTTNFYQERARVSSDGGDGFVVVWLTSYEGKFIFGTHGQRFDSAGTPVGGQFELSSDTAVVEVLAPTVAPHPAGGFITVATSEGSFGDDSSGLSIQARRWGSDGTPVGPEFQVNTTTLDNQGRPAVVSISEGEYVVVWNSYTSSGSDDDEMSIQAQRFDASSDQPIGGELQVNTYTTGRQFAPDVAPHGEGGFVVVWRSNGSSGADTDGYSVQGQRFDANGAPLGSQIEVNTYTTSGQGPGHIVADATGGFVVVWSSSGSYGTDDSSSSVQGRRYAADGSPLGGEFQINTYTTSTQSRPALAVDSSGRVVVWRSFGSSGSDAGSDSFSVLGQRYALGIFADGFESGGTSAWSVTVP